MENEEFDFHEIKTFEDACKRLGISENTQLLVVDPGDTEAFLRAEALYELSVIQKAINNGNVRDKKLWGFYPVWKFYFADDFERMSEHDKEALGLRSILHRDEPYYTGISIVQCEHSPYAERLLSICEAYPFCFNSPEAALYAGRQFESLFFQYYGFKLKDPQ